MSEAVSDLLDAVDEILNDRDLSKRVVKRILQDFGGAQVYLPLPHSAFRREDAPAIYEEYDGTNTRELCSKYGVSFNTLYRIIREEKARIAEISQKKTPQSFLFDE